MTPQQFIEEYAKDRRKRELDILKKLEPYLSISSQKKAILITLVTKQDLWWSNRLQVKEYYTKGEYNKLISEIQVKRGSANFIHEYCSASLVIENLVPGSGELLIPTTQGYDQRLKLANFKSFLNIIQTLSEISLNIKEGY